VQRLDRQAAAWFEPFVREHRACGCPARRSDTFWPPPDHDARSRGRVPDGNGVAAGELPRLSCASGPCPRALAAWHAVRGRPDGGWYPAPGAARRRAGSVFSSPAEPFPWSSPSLTTTVTDGSCRS
jgi:hypothetical protein